MYKKRAETKKRTLEYLFVFVIICLIILVFFLVNRWRVIHHSHVDDEMSTQNDANVLTVSSVNMLKDGDSRKKTLEQYYSRYYRIAKLEKAVVLAMIDSNFYDSLHTLNCLQKSDATKNVIIVDLNLQTPSFINIAQSISGTIYIKFPKYLYRDEYGPSFMEDDMWISHNVEVWAPLVTRIAKEHTEIVENVGIYMEEAVSNLYATVDQTFLICHESEPSHAYQPKRFALVVPLNYDQIHHTTKKLTVWEKERRPCIHESTGSNVDLVFLYHTKPNEYMEKVMMQSVKLFEKCFFQIKSEYADLKGLELRDHHITNHLIYRLLSSKSIFLQYTHFFFMDIMTLPIINNWLEEFMYRVGDTPYGGKFSYWIKGSILSRTQPEEKEKHSVAANEEQKTDKDKNKQHDQKLKLVVKDNQNLTSIDALKILAMDPSAIYSLASDFRSICTYVAQRELDRPFMEGLMKTLFENESLLKSYFHMIQYDDFLVKFDDQLLRGYKLSSSDAEYIQYERRFTIFTKLNSLPMSYLD